MRVLNIHGVDYVRLDPYSLPELGPLDGVVKGVTFHTSG